MNTDTEKHTSAARDAGQFTPIKYAATRAIPTWGTSCFIRVEAQAYWIKGNSHPHFSVTAAIGTPSQLKSGNWQAGGCLHEEILRIFPKLASIVRLHLSNADDGEPMHAEANGYYNLAGAIEGNLGEKYHRGNSEAHFPCTPPADKPWQKTEYRLPTRDECLAMLAEHLRITPQAASDIRDAVTRAYNEAADLACISTETPMARSERHKAASPAAKAVFHAYVDALRPSWQEDAQAGRELLQSLND